MQQRGRRRAPPRDGRRVRAPVLFVLAGASTRPARACVRRARSSRSTALARLSAVSARFIRAVPSRWGASTRPTCVRDGGRAYGAASSLLSERAHAPAPVGVWVLPGRTSGLPGAAGRALSSAREERARAVTARDALGPGACVRSAARWRGAVRKRRAKGESATRRGGLEELRVFERSRAPSRIDRRATTPPSRRRSAALERPSASAALSAAARASRPRCGTAS